MSDNDIIIKASGVSKKFSRNLTSLMKYGVYDIGKSILGLNVDSSKLRKDEFWAVGDVSFELCRGETLGIIGTNGSGKSTMLKMLNGIYMPDKGSIEIKGKVGALIEVGAGFHPLLTGRENIYVNGAILGMAKKEIDAKFDDIVAFADIGDFLDSPVKNYSSGMYVRLGFAVAVHTEPDILLVDEILSVGDVGFRAKSMKKIKSLLEIGTSVVFVSHDISTVIRICNRIMCLQKGKNIFIGEPEKAMEYYKSTTDNQLSQQKNITHKSKDYDFFEDINIFDINNNLSNRFKCGDLLKIEIRYTTDEIIHEPNIILSLNSIDSSIHTGASTHYDGYKLEDLKGSGKITLYIEELILGPGDYFINVSLLEHDNFTIIKQYLNICHISIVSQHKIIGNIELKHKWQHTKINQ